VGVPLAKGLILASGSPRRKELLECSAVRLLAVEPANIPEVRSPEESPVVYCCRLAHQKAATSVAKGHWVLAADTIVVDGSDIFEKPTDAAHAFEMLHHLSQVGWHDVLSAWALRYVPNDGEQERWVEGYSVSKVHFRQLRRSEIEAYVATGEPFDKAGAYGIQGKGACLVQEIQGSYSNIVGLPLAEVLSALRENGIIDNQ
jgi:septum formation protein